MLYTTEYREAASRAYLEHIRSLSELTSLLNVELACAVATDLGDGYIDSLLNKRSRYEEEIEEASTIIDNLDETTAEVLRRQYIECQSQDDIADDIGYVVRSIRRYAKSGREKLFDHLPDEYR